MPGCPHCAHDAPEGSRFCPSCATPLDHSEAAETRTSLDATSATPATPAPGASFVPGALFGGRYRIVGLLGRGGMGEVYRADDLKLNRPVALKFLPAGLERDRNRLDRLLNEVGVALKVTHPNVCRVHDIGEVDGRHYISMEYIDGEDLASLLRRIGRLPQDKAVQIARELCLGLAAAHEQGILHRDLKPANVMIDGRGRSKITDFGLAGVARVGESSGAIEGTPAYMAPEQGASGETSERSDVYALGLLLYELFTGKRAFEGKTAAELHRQRDTSTPSSPSSHVEGLDPSVERVILRCLEKDPDRRPPSAHAVAAALPGGDPLAAALAAGETPSPEAVAAAGEVGTLRSSAGIASLVLVALGLVATFFVSSRGQAPGWVDLEKPAPVLIDTARELIREFGVETPRADSAHGFVYDADLVNDLREKAATPDRWEPLRTIRPGLVSFWYRESPRPMVPLSFGELEVLPDDPSLTVPGMVRVRLDAAGRLLGFRVVPPLYDPEDDDAGEPDWTVFFERAGIDPGEAQPTASVWSLSIPSDRRRAWTATFPGQPDVPIHIETGSYRGRPVLFDVIPPWTRAEESSVGEQFAAFGLFMITVLPIVGIVLARRNLRVGRGDSRSARRLAFFLFAVQMTGGLLLRHYALSPMLIQAFIMQVSGALFVSALAWLFYVALEPHVRRLWPDVLVSWSRLLQGRVRDPMIGRDIVVGAVVGVANELLHGVRRVYLAGWFEAPAVGLEFVTLDTLEGLRKVVGTFISILFLAPWLAIVILLLLLTVYIVVRRKTAAVFGTTIVMALLVTFNSENPALESIIIFVAWGLFVVVLVRFGLFALCAATFYAGATDQFIISQHVTAWYGGPYVVCVALLMGLAIYGFYLSRAGQPVFGGDLLEEPAR